MPPKRAAPILTTVTISTKGDVKKANLPHNDDGEITLDTIQKYFRKKEAPEEIARYSYNDRQFIVIGYKKGKAGTENKYDLPSPFGKQPKFGDMIVLQVNEGQNWTDNSLPMTPEQWKDFVENEVDDDDESADGKEAEDEDEDEDEELFDEEEDADGDEDEENEDEEGGESEEEDGDEGGDGEDGEEGAGEADDDDIEPEPHVVRRRKTAAPAIKITDMAAFREEVDLTTPASSHPIRAASLAQLKFLESSGITEDAICGLESAIFRSAFEQAKRHYVPRNWTSVHFQELYKQTTRQILWNLHPSSPVKNPRLLQRVLDGEFPLEQLATMTAYDMYPEHWHALAEKQLVREQKILEGNKSRATDQYKCHRCGKRECTYYEMQTRSADEPMTIFITCINCGKQWRN